MLRVARLVVAADDVGRSESVAAWERSFPAVDTLTLSPYSAVIFPGVGDLQLSLITHEAADPTSWAWPAARLEVARALAAYSALVCGDGCDPTDAAALLELAAACAVPVVLLRRPVVSFEGTRLARFPFVRSQDVGLRDGASDTDVISAAVKLSASARWYESHVVQCRTWLHARRSDTLLMWAKMFGPAALREPTHGAPVSVGATGNASGYDALSSRERHTVAFMASELAPFTSGGAGVVAAALAISLVNAGVPVIVVADVPCDVVSQWTVFARRRIVDPAAASADGAAAARPLLTTHCVDALLGLAPAESRQAVTDHADPYVRASARAAAALQVAYVLTPFAAVEFFDFNGPAYELLRARVDGLAGGKPQYIPAHVRVLVRAHGTMGAIDEIEVPLREQTRQQSLRHRMEQYTLEAADSVLLQSDVILRVFSRAYQLRPGSAVLAPPPMRAIIDTFLVREAKFSEEESCFHEVDALPLPCGTQSRSSCVSFLVLGKLQIVKSPKTVASALGLALSSSSLPQGQQLHAVFVGGDAFDEQQGRHVSEILPALVPRRYRSAVHVAPPVSKPCVPLAVSRLRPVAAVIASEFETYSLVAHELVRLGLPLIVSDAAGFAAFFNRSNAYVFRSGDATSLSTELLAAAADAGTGRPRFAGPMHYDDAVAPYSKLLETAQSEVRDGNATSRAAYLWPSAPLRQLLRSDRASLQAGGASDNGTVVKCG